MSDNPDNNWEVVLSGSLTHRWEDTEPLPLPIEELDLDVGVIEKQFIKFEIVSYYGLFGGLEYFDILRAGTKEVKTELKRDCSPRSGQCPALPQFCPHPDCVLPSLRWADTYRPGQVQQGCSYTRDGLSYSSQPRCLSRAFGLSQYNLTDGVVILDTTVTMIGNQYHTFLPCQPWSESEPCHNKQPAVANKGRVTLENLGESFSGPFF